jgi:hypothetical protein
LKVTLRNIGGLVPSLALLYHLADGGSGPVGEVSILAGFLLLKAAAIRVREAGTGGLNGFSQLVNRVLAAALS